MLRNGATYVNSSARKRSTHIVQARGRRPTRTAVWLLQRPFSQNIVRGNRRQSGQSAQEFARSISWQVRHRLAGLTQEEHPRADIGAVTSAVDERPQSPCRFALFGLSAQQTHPDTEENPAAELETLGDRFTPRERRQQGQPCIFERRQLLPVHAARQKFSPDSLERRLGRRRLALIELLQALAPPRHADGAELWIARRRHDVGEREIELPESEERRSDERRQLLKRNLPIGIEPALSDR